LTHRLAALNGAALPCVSKFTLDHMIALRYRQDITMQNKENLKWQ